MTTQNKKADVDRVFDGFMTRDGQSFAGLHITIDLYDAAHLDDIDYIEAVMRECVLACGAHLLDINLHHFTPTYGVTGTAALAESHMTVHTWPERKFAAFDVFMCGQANPELAVPILKHRFSASRADVEHLKRGEALPEINSGYTPPDRPPERRKVKLTLLPSI
jgi:S-adenosylmethionine decarboxylase